MSIVDFLKKQFIDIIQWTEEEDGVLALRYPMRDMEIRNGAQLTVRETQLALFVNQGKLADIFEPGQYTLTTKTLPVMTYLENWDKGFQSPFKSDVYFFSTRLQTDQKWGTQTPVTIREKEFGPIRIRAYGNYAFRVKNPKTFFQTVSGSRDVYRTMDLEGQLRATIQTELASFLGRAELPFVDMAASQTQFSATLKTALAPAFEKLGLELDSFLVESLSLPDELEKRLDERAGMSIVGDMSRYIQFETARNIQTAAANPGGAAGAGAQMGAGIAMGQAVAGAFQGDKGGAKEDAIQTLNRLHELLKSGALTQAEFDAKKAELLKKIQ